MPAQARMDSNATDARELLERGYTGKDSGPCTPSRIAYEVGKLRLHHYAPVARDPRQQRQRRVGSSLPATSSRLAPT